ncbi:hypothetical protein CALCODRAFT_501539 [Calocera cornea HHB12733]|uniref:Uncharacterized protein n=1 Tax=Calocera cornea HHB12733 TaxID=1353952 RepID=A0A165DKV0_9BASI|nr:hypothetical protein CALCODRAFT_501539 [Calocera cornea HHB12733]
MSRGTKKKEATQLNWKHSRIAALDWKTYVTGMIYFGASRVAAAVGAFLATIIAYMSYTAAWAQLLTVPTIPSASVVLIMTTFGSEHYQFRGSSMILSAFIGGTGYLEARPWSTKTAFTRVTSTPASSRTLGYDRVP